MSKKTSGMATVIKAMMLALDETHESNLKKLEKDIQAIRDKAFRSAPGSKAERDAIVLAHIDALFGGIPVKAVNHLYRHQALAVAAQAAEDELGAPLAESTPSSKQVSK